MKDWRIAAVSTLFIALVATGCSSGSKKSTTAGSTSFTNRRRSDRPTTSVAHLAVWRAVLTILRRAVRPSRAETDGGIKTSWKCVAAVMAAGAVVAGCGADNSDVAGGNSKGTNTVTGYEREWKIVADHTAINAGDVTFTFTNKGTISHELLVIRTDLALGAIPVGADGKFKEDDPDATNVGESGEYEVGLTKTFKVKLAPGKYQLVCNLPSHYKNGMHIALTVD